MWLKSDIFDKKNHLEELKGRFSQQLKWNSNWQDTLGKKCNLQFLSKLVLSGCFELLKKEQIWNFNEIWLKKWENLFWTVNFSFIWWATLLKNSSYELHGTYVSGFTFLLHQEGPKKPQSFVSLLSWGWNSLPGACSDLDLLFPLGSLNTPVNGSKLVLNLSLLFSKVSCFYFLYQAALPSINVWLINWGVPDHPKVSPEPFLSPKSSLCCV